VRRKWRGYGYLTLFNVWQKSWVLERRYHDKIAQSEKFSTSLAKYNKA